MEDISKGSDVLKLRTKSGEHPLRVIWRTMISRCHNKKDTAYLDYGARGIAVCEEWIVSFETFFNWCITHDWQKGLHIDRRGNNEGYSPNNCRIVTPTVNGRNKRDTRYLTLGGITKPLLDWLDDFNVKQPYSRVKSRLDYGWTFEEAISKPKSTVLKERPQGEKSFRSKLTNEQAVEIFLSKEGIRPLARKYGLNHKAVLNIKNGKSYSCVTSKII